MHQEREKLKSDLQKIRENGFLIDENHNISEYVRLMVRHIGDVDPKLRDELIFETFYYWINVHNYFKEDELKECLLTLLDEEHLFYKIGEYGSDSVFTRSFSMLVLSVIVNYQKEKSFLDKNTFISLKNALVRYYKTERDFRGYVENKGWAHSAAHGADALNELVQCQESNEDIHKEVLESIEEVLFNKTYKLCYKEDDRIANVIYSIYEKKHVLSETLIEWLSSLVEKVDFNKDQWTYISSINFRNFNRSLYFKLEHYKCDTKLLNAVLSIEKNLNSTNF